MECREWCGSPGHLHYGGKERASEQERWKTGDLHVPDVVDVERLLQADNQPLECRLCKGK